MKGAVLTGFIVGIDKDETNFIFNTLVKGENVNYLLPIEDAYMVNRKKSLSTDREKHLFISHRLGKAITVLKLEDEFVSALAYRRSLFQAETERLKVGEVYRSRVVRVEPYGAFVMLVGEHNQYNAVGFLYKKDICVNYILDVKEVYSVGDEIYCRIKDIDTDKMRIALESTTVFGTWYENVLKLKQGSSMKATVHGTRDNDIFVELSPNVVALGYFDQTRVLEGATRAGLERGDQVEVYVKAIHCRDGKKKIKVEIDRMLQEKVAGKKYERPILICHKTVAEIENAPEPSDELLNCYDWLSRIAVMNLEEKQKQEDEMEKVYASYYGSTYGEVDEA